MILWRYGFVFVALTIVCAKTHGPGAAPTSGTTSPPHHLTTPPPTLFPDDPRLARPVRLAAAGTPLPEIVASLSKQTKVALGSDPGLKELKAVALARDLPLRTAMRELGALFDAGWSRRSSGAAARYVLARGPAARRRAADLRDRFWQMQAESVGALLRATRAEDASSALQTVNPTVARKWHRPQIPALLRLFDLATRGRYVVAGAAQRPSTRYRDLTPAQQAEAREALAAAAAWHESLGQSEQAQRLREAVQQPDSLVLEGFLSEIYTPYPAAPEMKVGERVLSLRIRDDGGEVVPQMGIHVGPIPLPPDRDAPGLPPTAGPALARPLRLAGDDPSLFLHRLLPDVARQAQLAVFADFFYSRPRPIELPARWEGSLEALLHRIDASAQTQWGLDGPALRLRNRRWYVDEARDPPHALLDALAAAVRQPGRLALDDCVRAAALDDPQLDGLKAWAGSQDSGDGLSAQMANLAEAIADARPLLRLYGSLSDGQRQALPTGLTLESLQVGQQPIFLEAAQRLLPAAPPEQRAHMRLRLDTGEDRVVFVALFPNDVRIDRPLPIRAPEFFR